jgi:polyhydroxyalkanoate synthase
VVDLQPGRSFVEKLLQLGLDVYAIDWGHPSRADRWTTLDDHVSVLIHDCVDVIRERHGIDKVNLLSICQGGVFNLCYTALNPDKVKNLVLTVTPVDFHADVADADAWRGFVNVWTRACKPEDIDLAIDTLGNLPGPLTGSAFALMNPIASMTKYSSDFVKLFDDEEALLSFFRMEKWLYDQPDHPGEAGREWLKELYQENKLFKNELHLGGRHVDLRRVTVPILNIYAEHDHVVPPSSVRALRSVVGSEDYTEYGFPGGHIGVFVGSKSQNVLAPTVAEWLHARS